MIPIEKYTCTVCGKAETRTGKKLTATAKVSTGSLVLKTRQKTTALKVTGLAKGDYIVSWKSGNTKIAKVTGKANGTSTEKVTYKSGSKTAKCKVTVK